MGIIRPTSEQWFSAGVPRISSSSVDTVYWDFFFLNLESTEMKLNRTRTIIDEA